ncbi:MAG: hypothetical protein IT207_00920 [Fimbriimonadaceae bacterium]|nr:hypothetical protein [Fimbriimonadaceae bacterium]
MISSAAYLCYLAIGAPVSFAIEPMPLDRALAKISAESGLKLATTSAMGSAVVQVSVSEVEPDALLARLAQVVGGTWRTESDGTMRLYDDTVRTKQLARDALAARTKKFDDEIARMKKELEEAGDFDPAKFKQEAGVVTEESNEGGERRVATRMGGANFRMTSMPGGRAIVRAIAAMNGRDFAAIAEGQRVVFSSAPTAMQKRMGGNPLRDAQTFLGEELAFRNSMPRWGPEGRPGSANQPDQPAQPPSVAKVFLIANGEQDSVRLEYFAASANGTVLGRGFLSLGASMDFDAGPAGPAEAQKSAPQDGIEVSEAAREAAHALMRPGAGFGGIVTATAVSMSFSGEEDSVFVLGSPTEGTERAAAGATLLAMLAKPSKHDPLSLFAGEAVKYSVGEGDLVACLPDSLLSYAASAIVRERSGKAFLGDQASPIRVNRADGWTVVEPKDLLRSRAERADRHDLELLASNTAKNGVMRLADLARYSLDAPSVPGGVDAAVIVALDHGAEQRFDDVYGDSRAALQVFGRLQGPDFAALESKIPKPLVGLSGAVQAVAGMVYNSDDGPDVRRQSGGGRPPGPAAQTLELAIQVQGRGNGAPLIQRFGNRSMLDERTEVLPTGLPGGSALTLSTSRRDVLYAFSPGSGSGRYTSPEQLGREAAMRDMFASRGENVPGFSNRGTESYAPTSETRYTLTFLLAPNITMTRTLVDPAKADTTSGTAANLLPDAFRRAYEKSYEEAKARMDGRGRQRERARGSGNPPPPNP